MQVHVAGSVHSILVSLILRGVLLERFQCTTEESFCLQAVTPNIVHAFSYADMWLLKAPNLPTTSAKR